MVMSTVASPRSDLYQAFRTAAEIRPDQIAFKARGGLGESYTYRQVYGLIRSLAAGLMEPEFAAVRCVGLLSENRPEWAIAYLAIIAAGKTVVPVDAGLKPAEISYVVNDAALDLMFVSGKFEPVVEQVRPRARVASFEPSSPRCWRTLHKEFAGDLLAPVGEVAVLIYTSGTTGTPKVVMLTQQNLLANLDGVEEALHFDHNDTFLSVLPLHHTFEATCGFLTPLMSGATIVYARSLKSKEILEDIARNHVDLMCGVPLLFDKMYHAILRGIEAAPWQRRAMFRLLLAVSAVGWKLGLRWGRPLFASVRRKAGLDTIRMFVSGGAPLPPSIARFFNLLGIDFLQGYGMTECSPVISVNRPGDIEFGSVGRPLPNLEVRIAEPDENGVGEIVVRGGSVTPGYRDNPKKTAELLRDGWLYTGDLGRFHRRHLWITGRRKNVIVSAGGRNIYPEELEEKLLASPYVIEALVFGRKRGATEGEEVRALIVPDLEHFGMSAQQWDEEKLRTTIGRVVEEINKQVAEYKRISGFDIRMQELEKTSTRKIKRYVYNRT